MSEAEHLLNNVERADPQAADKLLPSVYEELRRLASYAMANEAAGHTLQPTALVHEAWIRLAGKDGQTEFANRPQFIAAAAEAMRRILIENARRKRAAKRGGARDRVGLDAVEPVTPDIYDNLLAVHEALDRFRAVDPAKVELVKLRYFAGLTNEEAAALLGISEPTAKRWWAYSRAWLQCEIRDNDPQ
jgi:RNA polymerase sigma factor (TIGR02999 family)